MNKMALPAAETVTCFYPDSGEQSLTPSLMTCKGNNGALKVIVFKRSGKQIFFANTLQTGFQTYVFGNVSATSLRAQARLKNIRGFGATILPEIDDSFKP